MKYVNANDVLPEELLSIIQKYYQGGYLYIPKENYCKVRKQTDYKIELEKRNWHIYLKHGDCTVTYSVYKMRRRS